VDGLGYPSQWRLIDLWNNLYILGAECLGTVPKLETNRQWKIRPQPAVWQAATVLSLVVLACLADLRRRIRAVEVVT
jgi:hypothetical protein